MGRIFNRSGLKKFRRSLRNDRSPAEHILWRYLRGRQMLGYKFRRQHSIGRWIVDFYCPELRVAIEVDGDSHYSDTGVAADRERENYFRQFGIRTIHVRNDLVLGGELLVVEQLKQLITTPTPPHLRRGLIHLTLPCEGGVQEGCGDKIS